MFESIVPEHIVAATIIISLLSYFFSYKLPNYAQARILRFTTILLIICNSVYGWAASDSMKFGFFAMTGGILPIMIHVVWRYFRDHFGLMNNAANKITPANFQFSSKKPVKKSAVASNAVNPEEKIETKAEEQPDTALIDEPITEIAENENIEKTDIPDTESEKTVDEPTKDTGE